MADVYVRLIGHAERDPGAALEGLQALAAPFIGGPWNVHVREPYGKLGLYSDAISLAAAGPSPALISLYEATVALSSNGWVEDEPNRYETLREAVWDHRRADEPLLDAAVAWAHVQVRET